MSEAPQKELRYEIHQIISVNDEEYTLYNYLEKLRKERGLTKSRLSTYCGHSESWYSQFKAKDHRVLNIKQNDLNNLISILVYNVHSPEDLLENNSNSEIYIQSQLRAVHLDQRQNLRTYELLNKMEKFYDPDKQDEMFQNILYRLSEQYRQIYNTLSSPIKKLYLFNLMLQQNSNLFHQPFISLHYYSFPYYSLFTTPTNHCQINTSETTLEAEKELFEDFNNLFEKYCKHTSTSDLKSFIDKLIKNLQDTYELL